MPFVSIRLVKEVIEDDPVAAKATMSKGIVTSICQATGLKEDQVWVVFEEVPETEWFVGKDRVKELRRAS